MSTTVGAYRSARSSPAAIEVNTRTGQRLAPSALEKYSHTLDGSIDFGKKSAITLGPTATDGLLLPVWPALPPPHGRHR